MQIRSTVMRWKDAAFKKPSSGLLIFGVLACGIGVAILVVGLLMPGSSVNAGNAAASPGPSAALSADQPVWAAAAPGRVEPKGRELRINATVPAAIEEVAVQPGDRVKAGDLLIRLDDEELKAKLDAAEAEVAAREADRNSSEAKGGAHERRKAEDNLYDARHDAFEARLELDRLIALAHANKAEAKEVEQGRNDVSRAEQKVEHERAALQRVLAKDLPALTRQEAALAAARADAALASAALERTHLRSPIDAEVLELHAKPGEITNQQPETPLAVLGDTAHLQVRAEVQERDLSKVYAGQAAAVRSDAFPGRSFDARVSLVAHSLAEPQLLTRGQRKPTDVDVLEVILDLADGVPLLPGMRTDVFFKEAGTMQKTPLAKTE